MNGSRSYRLLGRSAITALMALTLALLGSGYSHGADAAGMGMGMGGMGGMGHMGGMGGMGGMMGQGSQSDQNAAPAQGESGADAEGARVYASTCSMCHASGAAGAPRYGDQDAWAARISQGRQPLYDHALHGFRSMPPKGGRMDLTDAEVEAAVDYMVKAAGGWTGKTGK